MSLRKPTRPAGVLTPLPKRPFQMIRFSGGQARRRPSRPALMAWLGLVLIIVSTVLPVVAAKQMDDPPLTSSFIRQLQRLPYGIAKQRCLILRYRHVGAIQFYGSGASSGFSFQRGRSLIPEGLSMKLKNDGTFSWASGVIKFKQPLNVTRYNSLVLWVRTNHSGLRFWLGVQDPSWQQPETYQARTDILPFRGIPTNHVVQLVVPYKVIYAESPVNYAALNQIAFEFGEDTVGNTKQGDIEVLGIAFVKQVRPISRVKMVMKRIGSRPPVPVVSAPVNPPPVPTLESGSAQVMTPEPMKNVQNAPRQNVTVSHLVNMDDVEAAQLFKQYGFEMKKPGPSQPPENEGWAGKAKGFVRDWIQPYTRYWPAMAAAPAQQPAGSVNPSPARAPNVRRIIQEAVLYFLLAVLLAAWWFHRKRARAPRIGRLGKVLHEVRWLFSQTDVPASDQYEQDFWKGLASKNMRFAWLSTVGAAVVRSAEDQFYGETFLQRQVKLASSCGIRLFPSLSFVRTVFNYETFLTNPTLFHVRQISSEDFQLNDDELRVKEKDCFPIWIPPFWQKKFRLPQRLLVEFGKSIAFPHSRDSVEFNRSSPALRKIAIQTIDKFAATAPGVRIENATWLLNSKIDGASNGRKQPGKTSNREFWTEVIGAVKAKHPGFLFLADGVGEDAKAILDAGFDYFEDDYFMETLVRQIRLGQAGNLPPMLSGEWSQLLKYAIFNITRLLRPVAASETIQRQNILGALLLSLLPGVIQHDDNLPEELDRFIKWTAHSTVLRKGKFSMLRSGLPSVFSFARWKRRSLFIAAANFSTEPQEASVRLDPILEGIDENKLYLFNNALHGSSPLRNIFDQSATSTGPALALWGQNLRDTGIPLRIPGLSLKLFSVNLTRPLTATFVKEPVAQMKAVR